MQLTLGGAMSWGALRLAPFSPTKLLQMMRGQASLAHHPRRAGARSYLGLAVQNPLLLNAPGLVLSTANAPARYAGSANNNSTPDTPSRTKRIKALRIR